MDSLSEQELLALSDQELFRGGGCHVFADELYQRLSSKGFVLRCIAQGPHRRFQACHVYIAKGDTAVDCQGTRTESGMLADLVEFRRKNNYPLTEYKAFPCEQKSLFEVCKNVDEPGPHNCWYHRIGDHFVQECRRRARRLITSAPERYCLAEVKIRDLTPKSDAKGGASQGGRDEKPPVRRTGEIDFMKDVN